MTIDVAIQKMMTGTINYNDVIAMGLSSAFFGALTAPSYNQSQSKIIREVEIIDNRGSPLGELDGIDLNNKNLLLRIKRASNFNAINPHTGKPQQTEEQWANKQIYVKTSNRIRALQNASATRGTSGGSKNVPSLSQINSIKHFRFRLEGDSTQLRQATQNAISKLQKDFPQYKFDAVYGAK